MAKAKVIGIQYREGVSKAGNSYKADILHVEFLDTPRAKGFQGHEVGSVWCDRSMGVCPTLPEVGDTVDIFYNRTGYVDEVIVC